MPFAMPVIAALSFGALYRTTKDWPTRTVPLSEPKGLVQRFFAEFILSVAEGLSMAGLDGHVVKCTNVRYFDLE
jgi:hypothetical protein